MTSLTRNPKSKTSTVFFRSELEDLPHLLRVWTTL